MQKKDRLFGRLMKAYFEQDRLYRHPLTQLEWRSERPPRGMVSTVPSGIDLVAKERNGCFCAIQCKHYASGTRISKAELDSLIAASAREPFAARIVVDTGYEKRTKDVNIIAGLIPPPRALVRRLASRPFDWLDLARGTPEDLFFRHAPFSLRPHQQRAFDDVLNGFMDRKSAVS